jgi:hypothetical protein
MQVMEFGGCLAWVWEKCGRGFGCSILSACCDSSVVGWPLALVGYPSLEVSPARAMT